MNHFKHIPVLLNESIESLNINKSGVYIDGTFGRGGHSKEILDKLDGNGRLFVFDKDPLAIQTANEKYKEDKRVIIFHDSYKNMGSAIEPYKIKGNIDGIFLDLGVSSPQLDDAERGFSFMKSGALDMRMNNQEGVSAKQWLSSVDEKSLSDVLKNYGEERYAKRIAKAIIDARNTQEINNTSELAEIIKLAHPNWKKGKHPATQSFQGIRIFINKELNDLEDTLIQLPFLLKKGGRLSVISFHSLEDRMVKRFIDKLTKGDEYPPGIPIRDDQLNKILKKIGKAIKPSKKEISDNQRSRSAVLRIAEKL